MIESIAILDFGAQYAQLIARRVREAHIYCELFPWDATCGNRFGDQAERFHSFRRTKVSL